MLINVSGMARMLYQETQPQNSRLNVSSETDQKLCLHSAPPESTIFTPPYAGKKIRLEVKK